MENRKSVGKKNSETKSWFFEKVNIDKPLPRQREKYANY